MNFRIKLLAFASARLFIPELIWDWFTDLDKMHHMMLAVQK